MHEMPPRKAKRDLQAGKPSCQGDYHERRVQYLFLSYHATDPLPANSLTRILSIYFTESKRHAEELKTKPFAWIP